MYNEISKQLIEFIDKSPTCFHAVKTMSDMLRGEGFTELRENQKWHIEKVGRYFVAR